jgi:enoyl-CoA hydratase/carnithine racemase
MSLHSGYLNEKVLVDLDGAVATVTLNRPDRANALDAGTVEELLEAMWGLDDDASVRAVVLTGAGKAYCAGIDISGGPVVFNRNTDSTTEADSSMVVKNFSMWRMRTPVIVAINGAAIGAGLTSALLHDVIFVAEDARLSFRFSRIGVLAEANSLWLLPRIIGVHRALDLLLSGRDFSGREAFELGLAKAALPAAEVLPAAQAYAHELAETTSPISLVLIKRLLYQYLGETDRERAMADETDWTWWTGAQPDIVEAMTARAENRRPAWKTSKLDVPKDRAPEHGPV